MQKKPLWKWIRLAYGVLLSLMIILVGVLLIVSCVDIYESGRRPFSPESIGAHYSAIALPVRITLGMIFVGILGNLFLPAAENRVTPVREAADLHARLNRRFVLSALPEERLFRLVVRIVTAVLIVLLAIAPVLYFLDVTHFSAEYVTETIQSAVICLLVPTAVAMLLAAVSSFLLKHSYLREIKRQKEEIAAHRAEQKTEPAPCTFQENLRAILSRKRVLLTIRLAILAVAIVFTVLGILNGGIDDVLGKAAAICTECIGLG